MSVTLIYGKALSNALSLTSRNLAVPKQQIVEAKQRLTLIGCVIPLWYLHIAWASALLVTDNLGDARASRRGTSNRLTPTLFCILVNLLIKYSLIVGVMGIELISRRMMEELEILEFDENSLSGKGKISIDETTLVRTELDAIRKACCQYSQTQMTNLEIVHDGESFTTEKRQNDSGQVITDIKFGFEAKVKET